MLGADYIWVIEVQEENGCWKPRPDLMTANTPKPIADLCARNFAAQVKPKNVRVQKWKRA